MNPVLISSLVSAFIYLSFLIGIALIEYPTFRVIVKRYRIRHRLAKKNEEGKIAAAASNLLLAVFGKSIDGVWLIGFCIIVFITSFVILVNNYIVIFAVFISLLISMLPVLLLFSKLQSTRRKTGKEGIHLVTEIYRQYKISQCNITECLEKCLSANGSFKTSKKYIYVLLLRLRDSSSPNEIKAACSRFSFSLGGLWGRMLGRCIEVSAVKGTDISEALSDIISQLRTAEALAEERKRMNGEAMRMTVFLVPFLYIATVFVSVKYADISLAKFISNQFFTAEGVMFFTVNLFLFVINIIVLDLVDSERIDY